MSRDPTLNLAMVNPVVEVSVAAIASAISVKLREYLNIIPEQNFLIDHNDTIILRRDCVINRTRYNLIVKDCLREQLQTTYKSFYHISHDFCEQVTTKTCSIVLDIPEDQAKPIGLGYIESFEEEEIKFLSSND